MMTEKHSCDSQLQSSDYRLLDDHTLINETYRLTVHTTGIETHGWSIKFTKGPIYNSQEMEALRERLSVSIPDMVFGYNQIVLEHLKSGKKIKFNALDALGQVDHDSSKILKLPYSAEWLDTRKDHQEHIRTQIKPYDWTFTTEYSGTLEDAEWENEDTPINMELLKRPDPILYYNEAVLYEDEMADNGMTTLSVRLRVMPTSYFLLLRYFLRVDNLIFRLYDHRIYHEFGTSKVIRESLTSECSYIDIKNKIPKSPPWEAMTTGTTDGEDVRLLADVNWVASMMPNPSNEKSGYIFERKSIRLKLSV